MRELKLEKTPLTYLINPSLTKIGNDSQVDYESCESIPGYSALVRRASQVKVTGWNEMGTPVSMQASGLLARLLQHEVDHLNGILYIDKMEPNSFRHDSYIDVYDRVASSA